MSGNSNSPYKPREGDTPLPQAVDSRFMYCTCGSMVSRVEISIQQDGKPYIPIARMNRCCMCGRVERVYIIPAGASQLSAAQQNGITLRHVAECVRQAPLSSYSLEELKSGKLHGFPHKAGSEYNPNEHIEPRERETTLW